jgi:hypothetical protein
MWQVDGINHIGTHDESGAHQKNKDARAKAGPRKKKRIGEGQDVGTGGLIVVDDADFFAELVHGRIGGEGGREFSLGPVRSSIADAQAVAGTALGTPMRNQFHDFAIGEMSREKQIVFSPDQVELEHDQADRNRENQRVFEDEGQHDEA